MAKDVAILALHGMGKVKPLFYRDLLENLSESIGNTRWSARVSFHPVQYQDLMQPNEDRVWNDAQAAGLPLDQVRLRKFMLFSFADAAAMEHSANRATSLYRKVQERIRDALDAAFQELGQDPDKPVVVFAHSLGGQVLSNYLWDAQKRKGIFSGLPATPVDDQDRFRRLTGLRHLVTTGCNIPLFVSGLSTIRCFNRPHAEFTWDNFYDRDDVLGWPLTPLDPSFAAAGARDREVNVGGLFTSWNPLSHGEYWDDTDVLTPAHARLDTLIPSP